MFDAPTVSNSSCLIALDSVGYLGILEGLYGRIEVPEAVASEFGSALPSWVEVLAVSNRSLVQSLAIELGPGEAEAIALAQARAAIRLILDDKKARRIAGRLGLPVTGTLAVLLRAKRQGLLPTVRDVASRPPHTSTPTGAGV
jgi:hypothetical protein